MLGVVNPRARSSLPDLQVRHVLVPLDGSEFALAAMPTARVLAERFDAELHTISVAGADDDANRFRALGSVALGVDVDDGHAIVVTGGDPADVIVRRARSCVHVWCAFRRMGAVV
jgi:nucleotide-binding universal stress UspA family protein